MVRNLKRLYYAPSEVGGGGVAGFHFPEQLQSTEVLADVLPHIGFDWQIIHNYIIRASDGKVGLIQITR
jgi:hypothetical protein